MIVTHEENDTSDDDDSFLSNANFQDWLQEYDSDNDERSWQDNKSYGDQLLPKLAEHTRLYFSNIRGTKDQEKWNHVCSTMNEIGADIVGFSELNVDTAQEAIRRRLEQGARSSIAGQSILVTSSTPDIAASESKPGGTSLMTIGGGNCSRITSIHKDTMGRWAATRYQLDEGIQGLWVISIYQVCDGTIDPRSFTAARQQQAMISNPAVKPRQAFKRDLKDFVLKYPADEFIIGGDFNEEVSSAEMASLVDDLHLYDLISARHGEAACPHTYIRGKKRLDFILGTDHVVQALTNCGYEPYGLRYHSDHRGVWMDFDTVLMFGSETTPMNIADKRGLNAREPRDVLNWVTSTAKYLNDHNMNNRCQRINDFIEPDHEFAEKFDRDLTKGSLWGEKQANKLRPKSQWSPAFAEAWARVFFYNQALSFRRNRVKMREVLTSIKARYKLSDEIPAPRDINKLRKAAQRKLKKIRLKARELRREFLQLKAEAYARAQKLTDAAVLKKMQQSESMSKVFQKIKRSNEVSTGAVDKLELPRIAGTPPKECNDWRTTTVPAEIEDALLSRNQEHFGQAEGTPCTSEAMKQSLGYSGNGPAAELILEGEFEDATLDDATSLFLKHLKRKSEANKVDAKISKQQFLSKIKNWPEKTSTSPSKLHLGMYHALLKPCGLEPRDNQPKSAAFDKFIQDRDLIIDCRLSIINYALRLGYSFERWKDVENIMIRKDAENCRIHRLRVIHIYEADYNLILGIKWRQVLHHAEDERLLNEGTYGSRPGRSAHDPVLLEIFQNEIYRLSGKSGVAFDLDAASCYDRILAALASLSSQKYGMHHKVALVNATTLEEARFKLKTKLGASARFYKHTEEKPIHGTGQGSQNSPTIWLFVCSTLFDAFEETANGAVFESYDKSESITLYMVGFVDDCSQRVNDFRAHPQPPPEELIEKMRHDAQQWNDLLWSSGGLLEASKCSYHLICTTTDHRGIPMLNPNRCNLELNIQSPTQAAPIRIKSLSAFESHRTLGVWTSPSGSMRTQLIRSLANSKRHTKRIGFCSSPKEARTYYHSYYQTSVGYPNCCTSFTEKEAHSIEKEFTSRALNKCGFSKHLERTVTWAMPKRGGAGFMGLNTEQGLAKCTTAIKLLRSNGQPAQEFRILLTWIQAQSGFGSPILCNDTSTDLPHLRATWIPCLRRFLNKTGLRIRLEKDFSPPAQRENDIFIMEWLLNNRRRFTDDEVRMIATCREFLQITTLSDIATADGLSISTTAWKGPTAPPRSTERRTHMFNVTNRPPLRAWNLWRKALLPLILNPTERRLRQPLGQWKCNAALTRVVWPHVYSPAENTLYVSNQTGQYIRCQETTHHRFKSTAMFQQNIPADSVPAEITLIAFPQQAYRLEHWVTRTPQAAPVAHNEALLPTILAMEDWERGLLQSIDTPHSLLTLRQIYSNTQGICSVSNGSSYLDLASFGWKWCDNAGNMIAQCSGPAQGIQPTKLRAQSYGYLSFVRLLLLLEIAEDPNPPQTQTFYADCCGLIKRLGQHNKYRFENPSQSLWADWDVTNTLHKSLQTLRGTIREGNPAQGQDDTRAYAPPPLHARIHREATALAENYIGDHPMEMATFVPVFPGSGCILESHKGAITGQYKSEIRDAATWPNLQTYLCRRFNWETHICDRIDWEAMGKALSSHRSHQSTLVKHLTGQAPTGHIAHRNDKRKDPSCFSCAIEPIEDNHHITRCSCDRVTKWRTDYLADIHISLNRKSLHSDPRLLEILRDGMRRWMDNTGTPLPATDYPDRYHLLIHEQNLMGWDQVLRGRLSILWRSLQQEFIVANHTKGTGISGQLWTRTVAKHAIEWWLKVWKGRNDDRFGNTDETRKSRQRAQLRRELLLLYEQRQLMRATDTYIFSASVDAHMATTPEDNLPLQNWVNLNGPAIQRSIQANTPPPAP